MPALLGLGTPVWDFGARGTLVGLTRGSGRPEIVRAVLEGVAHRGADLVEASESDSGFPIAALRIDGGMTDNDVFVQALADAIGRPVEISPVQEATTLGAGLLAGLAVGTYGTTDELAGTFSPRRTVEPQEPRPTGSARERWLAARSQGGGHHSGALGHLLLRGLSTHPRRRFRHPSRPPSTANLAPVARYAAERTSLGPSGRISAPPAGARASPVGGAAKGPARSASARVGQRVGPTLPACNSGRNPISCRGLPMAMTARSRSVPAEQRDEFPFLGRTVDDVDLVASARASQHLQADAVLIGPEVGTGVKAAASARPASRLRAAATPASAATCQCSIRISSSPPRDATASAPCLLPPRCRRPRRAGRRTRRRCQPSARSPPASPSPARRRSHHDHVGVESLPAVELDLSRPSTLRARRVLRPRCRAARPRRCADPRRAIRAAMPKWAPIGGPQHVAQRDVQRLEDGDAAPSPAHVDATSAPMKPAPMTTTLAASTAVTAARSASESSRVRSVNRPSRWPSAPVPGSGRGLAPVAMTMPSPSSTVPSSSSTLLVSASSPTARRPSTSWTRCSLDRRLSASTAFSGGHVPASTCLESGGRS